MINENTVYKLIYKTIKDSLEWGIDVDNKEFFNYIDGIMSISSGILYEMNKTSKEDVKND